MLRKILPLTLLAGSLVFAALIFFGKTPAGTVQLAKLVKTVEPLPTQNAPATPSQMSQETINNIGVGIAKEIINNNQDGPDSIDEQTLITATSPDIIAQKLLQTGAPIDYSKFNPKIEISDLHIIPGSDKNLAENYIKNVSAISDRNFFGISSDFTNTSAADLQKLISAYQKTLVEFYSLNVPASLASIHMEKIKLFTFQKNLFENIANYKTDPMAALASLRMFGKAYDDLLVLDKKISDFAIENNLRI